MLSCPFIFNETVYLLENQLHLRTIKSHVFSISFRVSGPKSVIRLNVGTPIGSYGSTFFSRLRLWHYVSHSERVFRSVQHLVTPREIRRQMTLMWKNKCNKAILSRKIKTMECVHPSKILWIIRLSKCSPSNMSWANPLFPSLKGCEMLGIEWEKLGTRKG